IAWGCRPPYRRGMAMTTSSGITRSIGDLLREWRERRRLSQLTLALDAEVSTRHLSFLETGRARPSREMVLRLTERLEVPLRERNMMLLAAGFAPAYPERDLEDPALGVARTAIDRVLAGHEPFPALAIDRYWTLVAANRVVPALLTGVAPELLQPPINVLRLSLHPDGLAAQIANLPEWRGHLLDRLARQVELTADPRLSDLLQELGGYAEDRGTRNIDLPVPDQSLASVAMPLCLHTGHGTLSLISTTMVFGTPVDVTLSELAIEAFFPADAATADLLQRFVPKAADRSRGDR
ncbi:MAG TPA: helix-turn-helix transcriptional regulator, partial [Thermomicrobiales bacterium]|nr:helix-turn-helix transcriptional regulator [Thermomicrobiales bacterium]